MKKTLFCLAGIAAILAVASCGGNSQKSEEAGQVAKAGNSAISFKVDIASSELGWRGWKLFATSEHSGKLSIKDGILSVEGGKVVAGSFEIDMNSMKCTDEGLDISSKEKLVGHLMNEDFFNVAKYPTAKFEIVSVEEKASEGNTHEVSGNLTLRESTRKITFPATIKVEGNTVSANGKATINRLEWGINYDSKNLGLAEAAQKGIKEGIVNKDMEITISLKATK